MTWGELKRLVEAEGAEDTDEVEYIDVLRSDEHLAVEREPRTVQGKTCLRVEGAASS